MVAPTLPGKTDTVQSGTRHVEASTPLQTPTPRTPNSTKVSMARCDAKYKGATLVRSLSISFYSASYNGPTCGGGSPRFNANDAAAICGAARNTGSAGASASSGV